MNEDRLLDNVMGKALFFPLSQGLQEELFDSQISLNSSLPVVVRDVNQPAVNEVGCKVFVLAPFLSNRKSQSWGAGGGFTTCAHGKLFCSRCQKHKAAPREQRLRIWKA